MKLVYNFSRRISCSCLHFYNFHYYYHYYYNCSLFLLFPSSNNLNNNDLLHFHGVNQMISKDSSLLILLVQRFPEYNTTRLVPFTMHFFFSPTTNAIHQTVTNSSPGTIKYEELIASRGHFDAQGLC